VLEGVRFSVWVPDYKTLGRLLLGIIPRILDSDADLGLRKDSRKTVYSALRGRVTKTVIVRLNSFACEDHLGGGKFRGRSPQEFFEQNKTPRTRLELRGAR